jgi:branched-subunit amino acid permease
MYYGITPWGQTAGRGVVRIVNLNLSTLNNYSVSVSAVAPNVSMFYKNNWTNVYNISIGHGDGHILNTTASQFIGNWNGSSIDLWFYADCLNATAGITMNFSTYIDRVPS